MDAKSVGAAPEGSACEKPIKEPCRCGALSLGAARAARSPRRELWPEQPAFTQPAALLRSQGPPARLRVLPARRWFPHGGGGRPEGESRSPRPEERSWPRPSRLAFPPAPHSGANSTPGRVSHAAVLGGRSGAGARERRGPGREADRRDEGSSTPPPAAAAPAPAGLRDETRRRASRGRGASLRKPLGQVSQRSPAAFPDLGLSGFLPSGCRGTGATGAVGRRTVGPLLASHHRHCGSEGES